MSQHVYDGSFIPPESGNFISDQNLFNYQAKVLRELLDAESYVCVGRAADFVLKDKPNVLTVYIDAPYEDRIEREMKRQGIGRNQAIRYIDKLDHYRESYYKYHTGRQWKRVENYDLCLDSAAIGLDNCVEVIKKVIELRFGVKAAKSYLCGCREAARSGQDRSLQSAHERYFVGRGLDPSENIQQGRKDLWKH